MADVINLEVVFPDPIIVAVTIPSEPVVSSVEIVQIGPQGTPGENTLSSATGGVGSPEGVVDGNKYRIYYDEEEGRLYRKMTAAGTLTGWE